MDAILALLITIGVFIPCAMFGWSALRSKPTARQDTATPSTEVKQAGERGGEQPRTNVDVDVSVVRKVTNVTFTSIRNTLGWGRRPELPPGGGQPAQPGGRPRGSRPVAPAGWDDPDLEQLDDLLDEEAVPEASAPPIQVDVEVVREHRPPSGGLPEVERTERDALPSGDQRRPAATRDDTPDTTAPAIALPAPTEETAAAGQPVVIEQPQVPLEGVDMSQAPLVQTSDGTATRLPSISQMQAALATGGFQRLLSWLRAFKKASSNTLDQANNLHTDALAIARRTRTKYALAMQAFQAVQADRLDRATIARVFAMLEQAHREAVAAAAITQQTAALVMAAGGSAPTVAAAINTLQRNHGTIAVAVKAAPQPVPNMSWYKQ